ncbi:MAG: hypothetical protein WC645_08575 [Candidatus Margulisiibacteriota bacterium]
MSNGKIVYDVSGTPTTYVFAVNFQYGHKPGYVDLVSRKRSLDGTAYTDIIPTVKKTYSLEFSGAPLAQVQAFEAAYESGLPIDLYLDSSAAKTATAILTEPPDIASEATFSGGAHTWSISVEFEET